MRVLIADDNESLLEALKGVCEEAGDTVATCSNGKDALSYVRTFKPNVILLDLAMPIVDGLDVCRELRSDLSLAAIKVIALSGLSDNETRRKTAEAGFDLHLRKPISLEAVLDVLATVRVGIKVSDEIHT